MKKNIAKILGVLALGSTAVLGLSAHGSGFKGGRAPWGNGPSDDTWGMMGPNGMHEYMWSYNDGYGFYPYMIWHLVGYLIFIGLVILLLRAVFKKYKGNHAIKDSAYEALRCRLANGEVTAEEFERLAAVLRSDYERIHSKPSQKGKRSKS